MRFAIVGATHGNEFTGLEVCKVLDKNQKKYLHEYQTFIGNPEAVKLKKRYVDSDLNRSYGKHGIATGYEAQRSKEMTEAIHGKFDFLVDIHTTTSNMGMTLILTDVNEYSLNAACFLKEKFPHIKLIISVRAGDDCPYTPGLTAAGFTVEVGPIANSIVKASLVLECLEMMEELLNYDFSNKYDYSQYEVYRTHEIQYYPEEEGWYIHPDVDYNDFCTLSPGDPLFMNAYREVKNYEGTEVVYPLFINEAAYLENNIAMELSTKVNLKELL